MNLPERHSARRRHHECPDCAQEADGADADHLAYMNGVAGEVSEHGWAIPGIFDNDGLPPWAYSVGLWLSSQFPELVICGAPMENMRAIVDSIATRVSEGEEIGPDDVIDDICPARLILRPVHVSWRTTGMFEVADEFYGFVRPPYLQVVWADRNGRYPWEPRFQSTFADSQPILWLPRDDNPPGPWSRIDASAK
jgi:hypothetical protein